MRQPERQTRTSEERELDDLYETYRYDGKFVTEHEDGLEYVASVGSYSEPHRIAAGSHMSRKVAVELANANHEEWIAYEQSGYVRLSGERIDNAWVNIYTITDTDGTSWLRAVVKRGGYGQHVIDDDCGISQDRNTALIAQERLYEKIYKYINGLNRR